MAESTDKQLNGFNPLVSVVVCTYSRERLEQLQETLRSLESQSYGAMETVIVVDHNPSLQDELKTMSLDATLVTSNVEGRGLSGARNSGVGAARGEIIAFIDDDAAADTGWLQALVQHYSDETVLAAGGRIVPVWQSGRGSRWFPEEFLWIMGCSYRGEPQGDSVRNVIGCNMSFRAEVFEAVGGFNSTLGRLGNIPMGGEETEMCIRALQHWPGRRIAYEAHAVVHHWVPRSRQTLSYFVKRCFGEGFSTALVRGSTGGSATSTESTYLVRTLLPAIVGNLRDVLLFRNPVASAGRGCAIAFGTLLVGLGFVTGTIRGRK